MPRPRLSPERRHTLCASLRSRNACQHYTRDSRRATLYEFTGKMPRPRLSPERGHTFGASLCSRNSFQHFTRDISQKSHFIQKFAGKMPQPRLGPERGHTLCASLRSRNACQDFLRKFTGKMHQTKTTPQTLCEPAQSKRMSNFTRDSRRATLYRNLQVKCRRPKPRRRLCANLRSRHTCQDFTRATLCGNLQVKCRRPKWAQNADEHFVRACAVETRVKISQEPLYTEIYR